MDARSMVVNCVAYRNGERVRDITLEEIGSYLADDERSFVWLGVHDPDEGLLRQIQEVFGLHDLAIEDALAAHQRSKLEEYGETLFLVLHTAQMVEREIRFGETHIFVGRRFLVSVRHGPSLTYAPLRERCETRPARLARGPGFVLYAIMAFIVDNYRPIVDELHQRFDYLEAHLFEGHFSRERLEELYDLKRQLLLLASATTPMQDICGELLRLHTEIIPKEARVYFRDVQDHAKRVTQKIEGMREMATAAMSVNLALVAVGQNEIVKKLAGWGAILAIPTMVFSLYGMNFHNMPELEWKWSYPVVLGLVGVACVWLYRRLKRDDWL
jgi:magnesium transporter